MKLNRLVVPFLAALPLLAQVAIEPRFVSEVLPSGGLMQIKLDLTTPHPIIVTGASFEMDSRFDGFEGVALYSPSGEAYGVAMRRGTKFVGNFVSPTGSLGTQLDYPFLVVATNIRPGLASGTVIPIALDTTSFFTAPGGSPYTFPAAKPGTLTIGGDVSVFNIVPGGGLLPPGYEVRILGTGFTADTRVEVQEAAIANLRLISSTELRFTTTQALDLTGRRIRVRGRDNDVTYFSYLRAVPIGSSSRALLNAAYPVFARPTTSSTAVAAGTPPANGFIGIAVENPTINPTDVTLELVASSGAPLGRATVNLPGGTRYVRTLDELFNSSPSAYTNGFVRLSSSGEIHVMGLRGDDTAGLVTAIAAGATVPPAPVLQLTAQPASLQFSSTFGGPSPANQNLQISASGASVAASLTSNASWLTATPATGQTPLQVSVSATPGNLAPGTYNGSFTVTSPGAVSTTVPVSLTVSAPPQISASPTSVQFAYDLAGAAPAARTLQISSSGSALPLSLSAGASWLRVTPVAGSTPLTASLSINTTGLSAGSYSTTLTIAATGSNTLSIPVSLTVTGAPPPPPPPTPILSASPSSLNLLYDLASPPSSPTTIQLLSSAAPLQVAVVISAPWLVVSPITGATPTNLQVTVNATGLTVGTYTANLVILTSSNNVTIPVSLTVSNSAPPPPLQITSAPNSLQFTYDLAGSAPAARTLQITSSGAPVPVTLSTSAAWLSVSPTGGTTPIGAVVSLNPTGLPVGSFSANVVLVGAGANTVNVPVSLTVINSAPPTQLSVLPASLQFTYDLAGPAPGNRLLQIASTGSVLPVTLASSANWLTVSPSGGNTPVTAAVGINASGLSVGSYNANVTVTSPTAGPVSVPVTLTVTNSTPPPPPPTSAQLTVSPSALTFSYDLFVPAPITRNLQLTSSGANLTVALSTSAPWLSLSASSLVATAGGSALSVTANGAGLPVGTYSGSITLTPAGATPVVVLVTLNVTTSTPPPQPTTQLTVNPSALLFSAALGAADPPAQSFTVTAASGPARAFTASTNTPWLSVTALAAETPAVVQVQARPAGLAPGTYLGSVTLTPSNGNPVNLPVQLTVNPITEPPSAPAQLRLSSNSFTVNYTPGAPAPAIPAVLLTSTGSPISFQASSSVPWLTASVTQSQTPATLLVTVVPSALPPSTANATYTGVVTLLPSAGDRQLFSVTLQLLAAVQETPEIAALVDSASQLAISNFAPGQFLTIYGRALSSGSTPPRVLFDGIPAPVVYAASGQLNVQVPFEVEGRSSVAVRVEDAGRQSLVRIVGIARFAPALFTLDSSGRGAAAALNEDYRVNSPASPARRGQYLMLYGTGGGTTEPVSATGSVANAARALRAPVFVTLGGRRLPAVYAGTSPGSLSGLLQVNVLIPPDLTPGPALPVVLEVGGVLSQPGVTVAIE